MTPDTIASSYLVYCIYGCDGTDLVHGLAGVQERNVETVSSAGLCAVASALSGSAPPMDTEQIMRYGRIVAACHRTHATIPMRFGSVFEDKPEITAHLEAHAGMYKALLEHLTDCDEMGIRLLLPDLCAASAVHGEMNRKLVKASSGDQDRPASGKAYLARQKERHDLTRAFLHRADAVLSQWREFFHDLSLDCRWERPPTVVQQQTPILSICFLVRRQDVSDFRKIFDRFSRQRPEKSMLSGPWPPYSFVRTERDHP